ncbi:Aste57867_19791 [Aphanomyces stellatus]|uniref:Aste57867_19791 protein n=1 Tax=Aphanomyces stellatus TaxID=120398 RepID=A0A485LDJ2_9STRA|nr:hypothetical protein As57867_019726 [Aphanomyces stellatus]VFT96489.1 Aste57867_19791 [Aphanomyces stellatus]
MSTAHDVDTKGACAPPDCDSANWLKQHQDAGVDRLTPAAIHAKLEKLHQVDNQVEQLDADRAAAPTRTVEDTINWLKQHKTEKAKSSHFIESLLHWFRDEPEDNAAGPQLPLEWAQETLNVLWHERSYAVLNAPFFVDMMHGRRIVHSGLLADVADDVGADFKLWLDEFFAQVCLAHVVKDRLLDEKARTSRKAIRVVTQYDQLQALYEASLALDVHSPAFAAKVLECFNEVEATLRDEAAAVADVNPMVMTPALENEAFCAVFSNLDTTDPTGVYVAKLVAWMKNAVARDEFDAFMALFNPEVKDALGGNWMQEYAEHLHRLEPFAIEFHCSIVYSRSRADVVAPLADPTQP